jgi:hypothetical protein
MLPGCMRDGITYEAQILLHLEKSRVYSSKETIEEKEVQFEPQELPKRLLREILCID